MFLGQKTKYDRPNYRGNKIYSLRSIVDGHVRQFVDDGPFESQDNWHTLPPNGQRQQLIRSLQKRCPGDDSLPLYFADEPLPDLYHPMIGTVRVPVRNDAINAKLAEFAPHVAERKALGAQAMASAAKAEQQKAEAQQAGVEKALRNMLADMIPAASDGDPAPKRKYKKPSAETSAGDADA